MAVGFAAALVLLIGGLAPAGASDADLSKRDYRYLQTEFGVGKGSFTLTNVSADDAARLHDVINNRAFKDNPAGIKLNVADALFTVVIRTCESWELAHGGAVCPMVSDERLKPGWSIAEHKCIMCHLTGTTLAPSFFEMTKSGALDEKRLAEALDSGHEMSPITLPPQQVHDLALYINSLH